MIKMDTSKYISSGILSQQEEDGTWKLIAYRSKTMEPAECNYDVHANELLAIVQALPEWRRYIQGSQKQVEILTDHKNLVPFTTTKVLTDRQIRSMEALSRFDFTIKY